MRKVLNSRIFKIVYTVFVIIFTIFIASYLLFICLERKTIFDYAFYIVPDNSMQGSYSKNDVVVAKKIDKLILEVGNDIVYYGNAGGLEGRLIIHRITSIDNGIIKTKGDANNSVDSLNLTYSSILGVDSNFYVPYVGYFIQYVNEHLYLVAIVVTILILEFLLSNIVSDKKGELKDEK